MLGDVPVKAMIPFKDKTPALEFYEKTLGLKLVADNGGEVEFESGGIGLIVYETKVNITAEHTLATWFVKDVEAEVSDLKSKGVEFLEYDLPGLKTVNSIATDPEWGSAAWFKDPEGNILGIVSGR